MQGHDAHVLGMPVGCMVNRALCGSSHVASIGKVRVSGTVKFGTSHVGVHGPSIGAELDSEVDMPWEWAMRAVADGDRSTAAIDAPCLACPGTGTLDSLLIPC